MHKHRSASPHHSAAPVNAKTRPTADPTKHKGVRNVNLKHCTLNEVHGIQNNNNIHNHVSESAKQQAELKDLDLAQEGRRKEFFTQAGPRSASPLKAYLQSLPRISNLDPNAISQYAQDDAQNFIPLLQSKNHDILLATIHILHYYAFHRVAWRPVAEKSVITELIRLLSSKYPDIRLEVAKIFSQLSDHRPVAEEALKLGVIQRLVPLLSILECPELQKVGAKSLVHIVYTDTSRSEALKHGALEALIPLLECDTIAHDVVNALYAVSSSTNLHHISFNALCPLIGLSDREIDTKIKLSAALVLKNLTRHTTLTQDDIPLLQDFLRAFSPLGGDSQTQSTIITTLGNLGKSRVALESILPYFVTILPELTDSATQMLFCDTLVAIIPPHDSEAIRIAEDAQLPERLKVLQKSGRGSDIQKKATLALSRLREGDTSTFGLRKFFTPHHQ